VDFCSICEGGVDVDLQVSFPAIFTSNLGYELHGPADLLDLLLCQLGDKLGLHQQRLLGQLALAQNLEDAVLSHIDDRGLLAVLGRRFPGLQGLRMS